MKKLLAISIAGVVGLGGLILPNAFKENCLVLKVANWAEYIDEGSEEDGTNHMVDDFETWYEQQTGKKIRVEYCIADDNETLYNMIKMGDHFDLVCPSEYMIMKLVEENRVQKLPLSFFNPTIETNYYAKNVSPFIKETFEKNTIGEEKWSDYAAGYMWGTTGFVYNPNLVEETDVQVWDVFRNLNYAQKITAKNNVRDTYFVGLAMYYDADLRDLKARYERGNITKEYYQAELKWRMNDSSAETMNKVHPILKELAGNLYGFETDEGKTKMLTGDLAINYQWSGDGVYIIDCAEYGEDEKSPLPEEKAVYLNYAIPETVSNLWFDGWTLMKDCKDVEAATMFINFLSRPDNAVRNMQYIGYTSCIGSDTVFEDFVLEYYEAGEDCEETAEYDLNYYFNRNYVEGDESTKDNTYVFSADATQLKRQLFTQYPLEEDLVRCVAMEYFNSDANTRANMMWSDVTFL